MDRLRVLLSSSHHWVLDFKFAILNTFNNVHSPSPVSLEKFIYLQFFSLAFVPSRSVYFDFCLGLSSYFMLPTSSVEIPEAASNLYPFSGECHERFDPGSRWRKAQYIWSLPRIVSATLLFLTRSYECSEACDVCFRCKASSRLHCTGIIATIPHTIANTSISWELCSTGHFIR